MKKIYLKTSTKKKIFDNLKVNEGYRENVYKDTLGVSTIGYGHNLDSHPLTPEQLQKILDDREKGLEALLYDDLTKHEHELFKTLSWLSHAPGNVQIVLMDMAFNMGIPSLLTFRNTLKYMKKKKYKKASREILSSMYARQVGDRAVRNSNLIRELV